MIHFDALTMAFEEIPPLLLYFILFYWNYFHFSYSQDLFLEDMEKARILFPLSFCTVNGSRLVESVAVVAVLVS